MSIPSTSTASCTNCGAENLGTRFCETCGAPAEQATADPGVTAVSAMGRGRPAADPALPFRVIALLAYLVGVIVVGCLDIAVQSGSLPYSAVTVTDVIIGIIVGLLMLIAAAVGAAGPTGKAVGILFGLGYAGAVPLSDLVLGPNSPNSVAYDAQLMIAPILLFLCWGAGRPFRGAGYLGALVVVAIALIRVNVSPVLGSTLAMYEVLVMAVSAVGLVVVIQASLGFDGARPGTQRTSPAARASLVLILSTFLFNSTAGSMGAFAVPALVIIMLMIVLGIILGHVGFVTAGRRHERGRGLAATALVLGYLVLVATIALLIWVATIAASLAAFL